jgi:beta-phosphoglucomutase-like phosphatase (HAD superfamily)
MIKAVIFDLDGLLVDSEPVWFRVRTEMFQRFGMTWTNEDQKALMGRSTLAWIEYVEDKLQGKLSQDEIVHQTLDGMVQFYRSGEVRLMLGAQKALDFCGRNNVLGLASGSPRILIDAALESNGWKNSFSKILSSDEVVNGKPAPDVYWETMKRLKVEPEECVVVEDSGSGILAGKAAGARVIAVPNEHLMPPAEVLAKADMVIDSLTSIDVAMSSLE